MKFLTSHFKDIMKSLNILVIFTLCIYACICMYVCMCMYVDRYVGMCLAIGYVLSIVHLMYRCFTYRTTNILYQLDSVYKYPEVCLTLITLFIMNYLTVEENVSIQHYSLYPHQ